MNDIGTPPHTAGLLAMRGRRIVAICLVVLAALTTAGCARNSSRPPLVALFILDTVRRDYVEPCGEGHPLTPNLRSIASRGLTFCNMVAPGSWTLPVHASIFTGEIPLEHGALLESSGSAVIPDSSTRVAPLSSSPPTLAEIFRSAGYRTILVSSNVVLDPALGLARGFDHAIIYRRVHKADQEDLASTLLTNLLADQSPDSAHPVFLVVNSTTAHDPYWPVPHGVPWLEPTNLDIGHFRFDKGSNWFRFHRREFEPEFEADFIAQARRSYAWSVHQADTDLGKILAELTLTGWLRDDSVLIVTSDHGEMLGEKAQLGHGGTVEPEVLNVFATIVSPGLPSGRSDSRLAQSQDLFPTLLELASLPRRPHRTWARSLLQKASDRIAVSYSEPNGFYGQGYRTVVQHGRRRVVLSSDGWIAAEEPPGRLLASQPPAAFRDLLRVARQLGTRGPEIGSRKELPIDLEESLRALGYLR